MAKLGGYHRECVRDVSWHPTLPLLATGRRGKEQRASAGWAGLRVALASPPTGTRPTPPNAAAVSFDGTAVLWEPEVPGEAEAAAEEAEAVAEGQQPGSGQRAARRAGAGHGLPEPSGDQLVW